MKQLKHDYTISALSSTHCQKVLFSERDESVIPFHYVEHCGTSSNKV